MTHKEMYDIVSKSEVTNKKPQTMKAKTAEEIIRGYVEAESIRLGDGPVSDKDWEYDRETITNVLVPAMEEYAVQFREPSIADKWIPLRERLPEPEDDVLWCAVPVVEPPTVSSMLTVGFHYKTYTHWQPLPPPPGSIAGQPGEQDRIKELEQDIERLNKELEFEKGVGNAQAGFATEATNRVEVLEDALRVARKFVTDGAEMLSDTDLTGLQSDFRKAIAIINKALTPSQPKDVNTTV